MVRVVLNQRHSRHFFVIVKLFKNYGLYIAELVLLRCDYAVITLDTIPLETLKS